MQLLEDSPTKFAPDLDKDTAIETLRKMINGDVKNLLIESPDGEGTVFYSTDPAVAHVLKMIFEENENLSDSEE